MKPEYDFLIVGGGLFGATFAFYAAERGKRCLVVERRDCVGGNIRCETVEGITVHRYGAHIFHTSDKRIWDFVNSLVPFDNFINSPLARFGDRLFNLPFNMNTFYQLWGCTTPSEALAILNEQRDAQLQKQLALGHVEAQNLEEQALRLAGSDIYLTLIKGYTEKQWGRSCAELPAFIIKRLPLRLTFDNNYFNDTYQGIPLGGYNSLIDKLLEKVDVVTRCDFTAHRTELRAKASTIVYTGAIDEFFDYRFGPLDYRSVRFEDEIIPTPDSQGNAVVNYTSASVPFTRVIEHKHFDRTNDTPVTVVSREYSEEWRRGLERCYPVNDAANASLYAKYAQLTEAEPATLFGGRLGRYCYCDMDDIISAALTLASSHCSSGVKPES